MPSHPSKRLLPPSEIIKRLMETDDPFFLTTLETAQFLRVSVRTIWRWLDEGEKFTTARRVSDGWLIPAADIRRIMGVVPKGLPVSDAPATQHPTPVRSKRPRGGGFIHGW